LQPTETESNAFIKVELSFWEAIPIFLLGATLIGVLFGLLYVVLIDSRPAAPTKKKKKKKTN
jgi:hypothetical protein